jgi:hypothetical protein
LPAPYDSVTVGTVALIVFVWAVRSGVDQLRTTPTASTAAPSV